MRTDAARPKHAKRREAGVVMLFVMLMLLLGTTLASMTVHTITVEMRSAGYYRQQAQTHYIAESALQGVLAVPPSIIKAGMDPTFPPAGTPVPSEGALDITIASQMQNYGEPDPGFVPGGGKPVYRMPWEVLNTSLLTAGGGQPVLEGVGQSVGFGDFVPWYVVDFSDYYYDPAPEAGQDASGNSQFVYINTTVTVRGRTLLGVGGAVAANRGASATVGGQIFQQYTDTAYDMRAVVQLGPVPK